jgi:hypothetical protein
MHNEILYHGSEKENLSLSEGCGDRAKVCDRHIRLSARET